MIVFSYPFLSNLYNYWESYLKCRVCVKDDLVFSKDAELLIDWRAFHFPLAINSEPRLAPCPLKVKYFISKHWNQNSWVFYLGFFLCLKLHIPCTLQVSLPCITCQNQRLLCYQQKYLQTERKRHDERGRNQKSPESTLLLFLSEVC